MPEKQNDNEVLKRAMSLMYSEMEEKYKSMENKFTDTEAKLSDKSYLDPITKAIKAHENKMAKLGRITKEAYRRSLNRGAPAASNLTIKNGLNKYYPIAIMDLVGATITQISATEIQVSFSGSPTTPISGSTLTTTGPNTLGGTTTVDNLVLTPFNSPDLPTGGSIGSAATTVDIRSAFLLNQTTAGQTITIPNPTNTAEIKPIFVTNSGSVSTTVFGITLNPGESIFAMWDGDSYNAMKVGGTASVASAIYDGGTSTGAGTNTYTITAPNKTGALIAGDMFSFQTDAVGIAGASTLNVNGLGAVQLLLPNTSAPDMTQVSSGYNLLTYFNGTDFIIDNFPTVGGSGSLVFPFFIS